MCFLIDDWNEIDEVDENVKNVFIDLKRRENFVDVLKLVVIIAHDIFDDEKNVIDALCDDCSNVSTNVKDVCFATNSKKSDVCEIVIAKVDAIVETIDLNVSIDLNFFACRSRMCWCNLKLLMNLTKQFFEQRLQL